MSPSYTKGLQYLVEGDLKQRLCHKHPALQKISLPHRWGTHRFNKFLASDINPSPADLRIYYSTKKWQSCWKRKYPGHKRSQATKHSPSLQPTSLRLALPNQSRQNTWPREYLPSSSSSTRRKQQKWSIPDTQRLSKKKSPQLAC